MSLERAMQMCKCRCTQRAVAMCTTGEACRGRAGCRPRGNGGKRITLPTSRQHIRPGGAKSIGNVTQQMRLHQCTACGWVRCACISMMIPVDRCTVSLCTCNCTLLAWQALRLCSLCCYNLQSCPARIIHASLDGAKTRRH